VIEQNCIVRKFALRGKEVTLMASMLNQAEVLRTSETVEQADRSEGVRLARGCALDELPGIIFGLLTLGYIIQSLAGLAL